MTCGSDLGGRVALVTGAGKGLGRGICECLAGSGATVLGTSRDRDSAEEVARAYGTERIQMDVTDTGSVRRGVERVVERYGRIDILVNNAGINVPQSIFDVDESSWDTVLDTNLKGTFFALQAAASHMKHNDDGGRIVNITSQAGIVGIEERAAYGSSKGGASILTKVAALELAGFGITVNAVAPTFVATELTRTTLADPVWRERILERIPMGRIAEVEEVAAAVRYLASPAAAMVTGHTLLVDGGWTSW